MTNVVSMAEHKAASEVKPKSEARTYKGHRYILSYQPNASVLVRWSWSLKFTRTYEFSGSAATMEGAAKEAQRQVDTMEGRQSRVASS